MAVSKRVVLHFPRRLVDQPIVCRLVKEFELEFNILKASVTPREEGLLVLELRGESANYERGLDYLGQIGVKVQPLSQNIARDEVRCTHCGACVTLCPTGAFRVEAATRRIDFDNEKCIACGMCIKPCPPRAMEVSF